MTETHKKSTDRAAELIRQMPPEMVEKMENILQGMLLGAKAIQQDQQKPA